MKANNIHIDDALKALIDKQKPSYQGDYADFLNRLAIHESNEISMDELLRDKLQTSTFQHDLSSKNIIVLFWLRRIKKISLAVILIGLAYWGAMHFIQQDTPALVNVTTKNTLATPIDAQSNAEILTQTKDNVLEVNNDDIVNTNASILDEKRNFQIIKNHSETTSTNLFNHTETNASTDTPEKYLVLKPVKNIVLPLNSLSEFIQTVKLTSNSNIIADIVHAKKRVKNTLSIGMHFTTSFQMSHSKLLSEDAKQINKNYNELANNGKRRTCAINYGISFQKSLFRNFGFQTGISKFTILNEQQTNYTIHDAPVYDIDGSIRGYINTPEEQIKETISNQVDYIALPINLFYNFKLSGKTDLQVKFGRTLTGEIDKHTEKFNYKTLFLENYTQSGRKISFNNQLIGISINRDLSKYFLLSVGYERQVIYKINALSDNTEKVSTSMNNLQISLKYKL